MRALLLCLLLPLAVHAQTDGAKVKNEAGEAVDASGCKQMGAPNRF